jgi:tetratricopeptide (TPR) repeat protein
MGDHDGARQALRMALGAAGPVGPTAAFIRHQLGDTFLATGDFDEAERQNRIGLDLAPGFVPPSVGIAEAEIGRGDLESALKLVARAEEELPNLAYVIKLGDLYAATGRDEAAHDQYRMAAERLRQYESHGMHPDVDLIVFWADRGWRVERNLRDAFAVYRDRPTTAAADALAWALHAAGLDHRALRFARASLGGSFVEPSHFVHAGAIAAAAGRNRLARTYLEEALARATTTSPLLVMEAKDELEEIV